MDAETKRLLEEQGKAFADFREAHRREINELKSKGSADPVLLEKVDKANQAVSDLQRRLDELAAKSQRPVIGDAAEAQETREAREIQRKAFHRYLVRGDASALEALNQRAVSVGDAGSGGWLYPDELDRRIRETVKTLSRIGNLVENTAGGEGLAYLFDTGGEASGWVGETDARGETATPGLARVAPSFGEIFAQPKSTQKALDDMPDVESWLTRAVAREFAKQKAAAILNGNGVNRPRGLLTAPLSTAGDDTRAFGTVQQVSSGTSGDFDSDDLLDMVYALAAEYRMGASWTMESTTIKKVRKMVDDVGNYLWQPGMQLGEPSRLLGYPIIEEPNMPVVGAAAKAVAFGDWARAYLWVRVRGAATLRDPYTSKGNVVFYTTERVGGGVMDSVAYKVLVLS